MENSPFSADWMRSWTELQQKLWKDWSAIAQGAMPKTVIPGLPMDLIQKSLGGDFGAMLNPFAMFQDSASGFAPMAGMTSAMNGFTQLGQSVLKMFMPSADGAAVGDWTSVVEKSMAQFREMLSGSGEFPFVNPINTWNQAFESWNKMLSANPLMGQDVMKGLMNPGLMSGLGGDTLAKVLSFPGVGIAREKQEKIQLAVQQGMDFQKVFVQYQSMKNKMNVRALEILQKKLLELGSAEKKPESLRDVFVLLVDCLEEAHSEMVTGEAYVDINAKLVKTMMSFRKTVQDITNDTLAGMNIPNRRELDASHKKVQTLKRQVREIEEELRELRAVINGTDIRRVQANLEDLNVKGLIDGMADLKAHVEKNLGPIPALEKKADPRKGPAAAPTSDKPKEEKKGA